MSVQILCTRPNASELINGVKFTETDDGMLSEPISQDVADEFLACPGYAIHAEKTAKRPKKDADA